MATVKSIALIVVLTIVVSTKAIELSFSEDKPCYDCSQLVNNMVTADNNEIACHCDQRSPYLCDCCLAGHEAVHLPPSVAARLLSAQLTPNDRSDKCSTSTSTSGTSGDALTPCILDLTSTNSLLGTIDRRNDEPAKHLNTLPRTPNRDFMTKLTLYANEGRPHNLDLANNGDAIRIISSRHDQIYIVTHGFNQNMRQKAFVDLKEGLLKLSVLEPSNIRQKFQNPAVILVDWKDGAKYSGVSLRNFYSKAAVTSMVVGRQVAVLTHYLISANITSSSGNIHLLGHGLGAQVMHFAGEFYQRLAKGGKIGRITGLDPVAQGFEGRTQLNKNDAAFVDIIHSSAFDKELTDFTNLYRGHHGSSLTTGHVDFFPNGGSDQPVCREQSAGVRFYCSTYASLVFFNDSLANYNLARENPRIPASTKYSKPELKMGIEASPEGISKSYKNKNIKLEFEYRRLNGTLIRNKRHDGLHGINYCSTLTNRICRSSDLKNSVSNFLPALDSKGMALPMTKAVLKCSDRNTQAYSVCSQTGRWTGGVDCPSSKLSIIIITVVAVVLLLLVLVGIGVFICKRRQNRSGSSRTSTDDKERDAHIPLLTKVLPTSDI